MLGRTKRHNRKSNLKETNMDLNNLAREVTLVNALDIPQAKKDEIIAILVSAALTVADAQQKVLEAKVAAEKAAKDAALKAAASGVVPPPVTGATPAKPNVLVAYSVNDPTPVDKRDPTKYFATEFASAGFVNVTAPGGPVEAAKARYAINGQNPKEAVIYVIAKNYQGGGSPKVATVRPAPKVGDTWTSATGKWSTFNGTAWV